MKPQTVESLENYRDYGIPTGDFLSAVLTNDLLRAVHHGDYENLRDLVEIVRYLYNDFPIDCWGSKEKVKAWIEKGGVDDIR